MTLKLFHYSKESLIIHAVETSSRIGLQEGAHLGEGCDRMVLLSSSKIKTLSFLLVWVRLTIMSGLQTFEVLGCPRKLQIISNG